MKEKEIPQLSAMIITLANINDKLRSIDTKLSKICDSVEKNKTEFPTALKHFIVIKEGGFKSSKKEISQD